MWRRSKDLETIDASEKTLSTASDLADDKHYFGSLLEGLTSLTGVANDSRLPFQQGVEVFESSFSSVDQNGLMVIDEAFQVQSPLVRTNKYGGECKGGHFAFQSRYWLCQDNDTMTLGQLPFEGVSLFPSEGKEEEETVSLDGESIELGGDFCPNDQLNIESWNHGFPQECIFALHNFNVKNCFSSSNRVLETEQNVFLSSTCLEQSITGETNSSFSENKDGSTMDVNGFQFHDHRRAHYASNWMKANRMFAELYESLEKTNSIEDDMNAPKEDSNYRSSDRSSFETEEPHKIELEHSSSLSRDSELDSKDQTSQKPAESIMAISASEETPVWTPQQAKESLEKTEFEKLSVLLEQVENENHSLRLSLTRLQQDLEESRNETSHAKAQVSSLVSDLANSNRIINETVVTRSTLNKKDPGSRSQNSVKAAGFFRGQQQQSTYSEYLEETSKRSLISSTSGTMVSNQSSLKSFISRTSSVPSVNQTPMSRTQSLAKTDEFEAERLAFAEKLVMKEEMITRLEKQVNSSKVQLRQMEAGIDGLETRFTREINTFKAETVKQYQRMFEKCTELISVSTTSETGLKDLKQELQKFTGTLQKEVRNLEKEVSVKTTHNNEMEERIKTLSSDIEAKIKILNEAESRSDQLTHEIIHTKLQNEEKARKVLQLETIVAQLEDELTKLKSTAKGVNSCEDVQVLNERISSLELGLAGYESQNRELIKQLKTAEKKLAIRNEDDVEHQEILKKEKNSLNLEIIDLTEKLEDYEQEIASLKREADQQVDAVAQCASLEEQVKSLLEANRELELHFTRRKKHIDELQGDLKELRVKVNNQDRYHGFDSYLSNDTVSSQVDAVIQAERRYSDLEQILGVVQEERDRLVRDSTTKGSALRSLIKENQALSTSIKRQQKESSKLSKRLSAAKTEIATLRADIKSAQSSQNANNGVSELNPVNIDVMQELVSAKIALAEMDEELIKVRRELHASSMRNTELVGKLVSLESLYYKPKSRSTKKRFILRRKTTRFTI
eukprot:g5602.t1